MAELCLVPPMFVGRAANALRRAEPMTQDAVVSAISTAGKSFSTDAIGGITAEEHALRVARVSGLPIGVVRAATRNVAAAAANVYRDVQQARPVTAVTEWRDPLTRTGRAVWCRRGDVLGVLAAGNHPAVHTGWLQALALGYRVALRPSQREPFTPYRLVTALRGAGLGTDRLVLLPTDHDTAREILRNADLGLVYGSAQVVEAHARDSRVLPQGPGRSKVLLTAEVDWREYVDVIVESVSSEAGTACTNATAVLVEGDPGPLAEALADRLSKLPALPPEDEHAALPVQSMTRARALQAYVQGRSTGIPWLGVQDMLVDLGDGSAALRPLIHQLDAPDPGQLGAEMPFPCVWVAPWSRRDGIEPLRDTLVLTAITRDDDLVDDLVAEPTIRSIHLGPRPTHTSVPEMPHDGFLAEFLMRTKGVIR
ncbi:aldehyde dehydrogenase family protein [Streptomyces anatolicus]|uniref:aldehyde dehydrogenase family protein n=1 Tax=Streptomyces anatolicus TaxID=2675858 RepID=UPI0027E12602|nr:aldehyde dehydrogenase family protein [Streptomyces anatolicus]